jgi:GT2 family glycosyltransferase
MTEPKVQARQQAIEPLGVSIVVCCFNSASRLSSAFTRTLGHLATQESRTDTPWEVIVVDNASTDDTARIAQESWPQGIAGSLQVVREPQIGVSYARERGLAEAKYEFVSFIDDDNWVFPGWVDTVAEVMSRHPEAGACGGQVAPVFEILPPPVWFEQFKGWFAVGPDLSEERDVTESGGVLWTAGLTIRRSAWRELRSNGFHFLLPGHQGTTFRAGEDDELCLALRLLSWRLWSNPRLRLRHFLPAQRVQWRHLRRRARAGGESSVVLDPYYLMLRELDADRPLTRKVLDRLGAKWSCQMILEVLKTLIKRPLASLFLPVFSFEGRAAALAVENSIGRLARLWKMRATYDSTVKQLRDFADRARADTLSVKATPMAAKLTVDV